MVSTILETKTLVFSLIFFLLVFSLDAFAVTRTVTSDTDDGSGGLTLREAIDAANNGDVIEFDLPDGSEIVLNQSIDISVSLTINGPGPDKLTVSGDGSDNIFNIESEDEITVNINGLKFTNGFSEGGGAIFNTQNLNVDNCEFEFNSALFGGAIFNGDPEIEENGPCVLNVTNSKFIYNFAGIGGAIANIGTIGVIDNSVFIFNIAADGILIFPFQNAQTTNIGYGVGFGNGGAIANFMPEQILAQTTNVELPSTGLIELITKSSFFFNFAIAEDDICDAQTANGIGSQGGLGGAIFNTAFMDVVERSTFAFNVAGGDFVLQTGNIRCTDNRIDPQTVNEGLFGMFQGGAIYSGYVLHLIRNSTFYENAASGNGGAIYISGLITGDGDGDGDLKVAPSTIIDFCTITENDIGDFFLQNLQTAFVYDELAGGIATGGGGIVGLSRSIVYQNDENDCDSGVTSLGNNIDTDGDCTAGVANDQSADPMLGPLNDNGGPTPTMALLPDSPAIDGVVCDIEEVQTFLVEHDEVFCETVNHDQRGFNRPVDGDDSDGPEDDIGAYELQPEAKAKVTKVTDPVGETGFMFEVSRMGDPTIVLTRFTLDDGLMDMTVIPTGDITICELIPEGYEVAIDCSASTTEIDPIIDEEAGKVDATILSSAEMLDCIFFNTFVGGSVIAPPTFDEDEEIIVTPGEDGPFAGIIVSPGISGGGRILIDLPDGVFALAASLIPDISQCQILTPAPQTANVTDPDVVCEINDFPAEEMDLILDLCTEGDQSGVANAIVEVISDSEPEENEEEIIEIILDQLSLCQVSGDGDGDGDSNNGGEGGGNGCSIAPANTINLSNVILTLISTVVGITVLFFRRRK